MTISKHRVGVEPSDSGDIYTQRVLRAYVLVYHTQQDPAWPITCLPVSAPGVAGTRYDKLRDEERGTLDAKGAGPAVAIGSVVQSPPGRTRRGCSFLVGPTYLHLSSTSDSWQVPHKKFDYSGRRLAGKLQP